MLCDKCKERQANIHIKQSINGVETEKNLCEVCAREEEGLMNSFSMDSFFNDLFTTSLLKRGARRSGNMFEFNPQVPSGKGDRYNAEFMNVGTSYESGIELPKINLGAVKEETPKTQESDLKAQLKQAIEEENYEKAAELRDLIKKEEK